MMITPRHWLSIMKLFAMTMLNIRVWSNKKVLHHFQAALLHHIIQLDINTVLETFIPNEEASNSVILMYI